MLIETTDGKIINFDNWNYLRKSCYWQGGLYKLRVYAGKDCIEEALLGTFILEFPTKEEQEKYKMLASKKDVCKPVELQELENMIEERAEEKEEKLIGWIFEDLTENGYCRMSEVYTRLDEEQKRIKSFMKVQSDVEKAIPELKKLIGK